MIEHAPQTVEGEMVWHLAMKCQGQMRAVDGGVFGYDMTAVMAMGDALGVPLWAVAEWMPLIEHQAVAAMAAATRERPQSDK